MPSFPVTLRFRGECLADLESLQEISPDLTFVEHPLPAGASEQDKAFHALGGACLDFTAEDPNSVMNLLRRIAQVPDGHRMWQTLDLAETFTGDFIDDEEDREARILGLLGDLASPGERLDEMMFRLMGDSEDDPEPMS